ncbi:MAG: hypothetical protein ACTSUC_15610 [Promethearchaeota archaeon]
MMRCSQTFCSLQCLCTWTTCGYLTSYLRHLAKFPASLWLSDIFRTDVIRQLTIQFIKVNKYATNYLWKIL